MSAKKIVELPLIEPKYSTFHHQGTATAIIKENPSIRNWCLNKIGILSCGQGFLKGKTSPFLNVENSSWECNPYLDKKQYSLRFLNGYVHPIIRNLLNAGYYVYFNGIDDYYVEGKSWYRERHFSHDGCICGYNQENKTYCIYAYDSEWKYRKFWTTQASFEKGRRAVLKQGKEQNIYGLKAVSREVLFSSPEAIDQITRYMDSSLEKYPETGEGKVYGIAVQDYLVRYLEKLYDESIPYEKMDRRIFRLIWEHKKVMHERIVCIEKALGLDTSISSQYGDLVLLADRTRLLYASYHMKRRDSLLPCIQEQLRELRKKEALLLNELLNKVEVKEEK